MLRFRRVFDDVTPANRYALEQVREILQSQFDELAPEKIDRIPQMLRYPAGHGFRSILYVAEDHQSTVLGLALLNHDAELNFCFLDYLASRKRLTRHGVGGALYAHVRAEARALGAAGIFFECLPDEPRLCRAPAVLKQNRARLRFYEGFGARPIVNTAYETPVNPGEDNAPYLVFDDLGQGGPLARDYLKQVIARILEWKYSDICSPEYVRMVLESVREDPISLRAPRYRQGSQPEICTSVIPDDLSRFALIVTDQHEIHHVRERGYVEAPVRIKTIRQALEPTGLFCPVLPQSFADSWITSVHDREYVRYFKRVCNHLEPGVPLYPYVFPVRNRARPPVELPVRAGYYCLDTFTPLNRNAYTAARRAVDCALTGAREVLSGRRVAYALVRPPGHHAERSFFGGFCYFNNAAIAAEYLCAFGKVAMLDIDYHHGNGQQAIFSHRRDVLTVSIHGHPRFAYPYFSGFGDERGEGEGAGYNVNYPLGETIEFVEYLRTLNAALARIRRFAPVYLVVCLGLDTGKGDPTGTWGFRSDDFTAMGREIGRLKLPCLVVQEGGYNNRAMGANARGFFQGLWAGLNETS